VSQQGVPSDGRLRVLPAVFESGKPDRAFPPPKDFPSAIPCALISSPSLAYKDLNGSPLWVPVDPLPQRGTQSLVNDVTPPLSSFCFSFTYPLPFYFWRSEGDWFPFFEVYHQGRGGGHSFALAWSFRRNVTEE